MSQPKNPDPLGSKQRDCKENNKYQTEMALVK